MPSFPANLPAADPMSDLPSLNSFDASGAVARMLDQPALWWQALALFVTHFEAWETQWRAAIGNDGEELKRVHALRSGAANVGAMQLAALAGELEGLLRERRDGALREIPEALRQQLQQAFVTAWEEAELACRSRASGGQS